MNAGHRGRGVEANAVDKEKCRAGMFWNSGGREGSGDLSQIYEVHFNHWANDYFDSWFGTKHDNRAQLILESHDVILDTLAKLHM